ncbi:hypothetical protein AHF37_01257 [Paragonimus kellicotti]|nr:hypothetical protein AHF37_01257 [Paragonimus kellicotti]
MHAIRLRLNALRYQQLVDSSSTSPTLPVRFPMQTVKDIQLLNLKLEDGETYPLLINHLSKLGGKSVSDCLANLMKSTMTDDLAASINGRGVNSGFSLASTPLASAIVERALIQSGYDNDDYFLLGRVNTTGIQMVYDQGHKQ